MSDNDFSQSSFADTPPLFDDESHDAQSVSSAPSAVSDESNASTNKEAEEPKEEEVKADDPKPADAAESDAKDEVKADAPPELTEAHDAAQPVVDIAPELLDILKEVGNRITPVLKKFHEYEDKFKELETEAKARWDFARQKSTEWVASLEGIFKRG